jgi:hypothetical protein
MVMVMVVVVMAMMTTLRTGHHHWQTSIWTA